MRVVKSAPRSWADAWMIRIAVWNGVLLLAGVLALTSTAEPAASAGSIRVVEDPGGGVTVEWTRNVTPFQLLGWYVDRQLPDGGVLRVTTERVDPGLFDSPASVYRIHDASAGARAGDSVVYRLVSVDPKLREMPAAFASFVVEAFTATSEPVLSRLLPAIPGPAPHGRGAVAPMPPDGRLFCEGEASGSHLKL